eukprot:2414430-Ditylum_brightwellii.AAC.1
MRALNNWVKTVLIQMAIQTSVSERQISLTSKSKGSGNDDAISVLELACGKGGDFFKIQNACSSSHCRL